MAIYGIYGEHEIKDCPIFNKENAKLVIKEFGNKELTEVEKKFKINKVLGRYHSALEHTLLWILDAEDPFLIEQYLVETGIAKVNKFRIVPLWRFVEDSVPTLKQIHGIID